MKTLKEIFDELYVESLTPVRSADGKLKAYTDKNSSHCYVDRLYEHLFSDIRMSATKVLEIGIFGGGSMLLWKEYFQNAHVYGLDLNYFIKEFIGDERITQIIGDAYSLHVASMFGDNTFDVAIDDGPHTLDSFTKFIQLYLPKVKSNGYLIIEDIFDPNIAIELLTTVNPECIKNTNVYDFRYVKNLFDDVVLVIQKA